MHSTADQLREMGHTVDLLFSEDVPRKSIGASDRFVFPVALVKVVRDIIRRRGPYDVVEIHEPSAAWYCYQRKRDNTLPPCVVMSHGSEGNYWQHRLALDCHLDRKTSIKSRVIVPLTLLSQSKYSLRHSQQVMCLNMLDEQYFRTKVGIPGSRITRIRHGVEEHFFSQRDPSNNKLPRLLFVGTWLDNKGRHSIPSAFRQICTSYPGIHLSLLGTGFADEEVLACFDVNLHSALTVKQSVDDRQLRAAYAEHDILLLPSFFESWGLVLLEAAAAGLAIISSKAGGPSEIFQDQQNALLVSAFSPTALAEAVKTLIENQQMREVLGQRAQKRARQFTWTAAAESHLCAYERAIALTGNWK